MFRAVPACLRSVTALAVLGAVLAGCGSDDEPDGEAPARPGESPAAVAKAYDPPAMFGPGLPLGPVGVEGSAVESAVLAGRTVVWLDDEGLGGSDAVTGQERWRLPVDGMDDDASNPPPVVDASSGGPVVYAVVTREVEGTGTVADHPELLVRAVDPASGEKRWETPITLDRYDALGVSRLAASDGTVAVTNSGNDEPTTYALDAATGKVRWQQKELDVAAVGKGVVAGVRYSRYTSAGEIVGLDADGGDPAWTWARPKGAKLSAGSGSRRGLPLGPDLVFVPAEAERFGDFSGFIDLATGATRLPAEAGLPLTTCVHDQKDTVVCDGTGDDIGSFTAAFDAASLTKLWQLPQEPRTYVSVTAAFHGAVYGITKDARPVVLDARTGADRPADPGQAPTLVNEYAGLGKLTATGDDLATFPATG